MKSRSLEKFKSLSLVLVAFAFATYAMPAKADLPGSGFDQLPFLAQLLFVATFPVSVPIALASEAISGRGLDDGGYLGPLYDSNLPRGGWKFQHACIDDRRKEVGYLFFRNPSVPAGAVRISVAHGVAARAEVVGFSNSSDGAYRIYSMGTNGRDANLKVFNAHPWNSVLTLRNPSKGAKSRKFRMTCGEFPSQAGAMLKQLLAATPQSAAVSGKSVKTAADAPIQDSIAHSQTGAITAR